MRQFVRGRRKNKAQRKRENKTQRLPKHANKTPGTQATPLSPPEKNRKHNMKKKQKHGTMMKRKVHGKSFKKQRTHRYKVQRKMQNTLFVIRSVSFYASAWWVVRFPLLFFFFLWSVCPSSSVRSARFPFLRYSVKMFIFPMFPFLLFVLQRFPMSSSCVCQEQNSFVLSSFLLAHVFVLLPSVSSCCLFIPCMCFVSPSSLLWAMPLPLLFFLMCSFRFPGVRFSAVCAVFFFKKKKKVIPSAVLSPKCQTLTVHLHCWLCCLLTLFLVSFL